MPAKRRSPNTSDSAKSVVLKLNASNATNARIKMRIYKMSFRNAKLVKDFEKDVLMD
jgi:hypothetical protein